MSLGLAGLLYLPQVLGHLINTLFQLALVSQSDVCLTGDQEVTGLIPAGSGNTHLWRLIMKYFLRSFSSILVNCLED